MTGAARRRWQHEYPRTIRTSRARAARMAGATMAARGRLERLLCAMLGPVARAKSMGVVASKLDLRVCGCIMEPEIESNIWRRWRVR